MPELRTVVNDEGTSAGVRSFPVELLKRCSKEELCSLLILMHRILNLEREQDIDSLLINLPKFLRESLLISTIPVPGDLPRSGLFMDRKASPLAEYMLSCLVQAQSRVKSKLPLQRVPQPLSARELIVLGWMKEGKTNWEIARIIGLSERTVRFHVGGILRKLGVASRTQAVARALDTGMITS